MKHGFVCISIPETGLFARGRGLIDGDDHRITVYRFTLFEERKDALKHKRKLDSSLRLNYPGEVYHVMVLPVDVIENSIQKVKP
jgi:hypothetical protein